MYSCISTLFNYYRFECGLFTCQHNHICFVYTRENINIINLLRYYPTDTISLAIRFGITAVIISNTLEVKVLTIEMSVPS
nr:MAG TPA: alpha/beta hydrolase family protein [Caudoviricetes sp.]